MLPLQLYALPMHCASGCPKCHTLWLRSSLFTFSNLLSSLSHIFCKNDLLLACSALIRSCHSFSDNTLSLGTDCYTYELCNVPLTSASPYLDCFVLLRVASVAGPAASYKQRCPILCQLWRSLRQCLEALPGSHQTKPVPTG